MRKLLLLIIISQFSYSQERYITDEEFKEKVTWLLPHEENLPLIDVINKVPGYRGKGRWEVDGILHVNIPVGIISSHVKYIEIPQSVTSFSTFSEKLTASDLVELLNDYLTEMTDILLSNKGTLDKYIGDAIVAFYGAPAPVDDHEYWSCLTAVKMQERLAELREKWQEEGDRWPEIVHNMQNRIGINTGKLVTGNMGSTMRMNYTMMGDTVNLAARLEPAAKQYGVYTFVAENTYSVVSEQFEWRMLDLLRVKGKKVFIDRCKFFKTKPPGKDWDKIWTMTAK